MAAPPPPPPGSSPVRPRRSGGSPQRPSPAASRQPPPAHDIDVDLDGISLASSTSEVGAGAPEQRQRSLSFDDLYSLAPVQVGTVLRPCWLAVIVQTCRRHRAESNAGSVTRALTGAPRTRDRRVALLGIRVLRSFPSKGTQRLPSKGRHRTMTCKLLQRYCPSVWGQGGGVATRPPFAGALILTSAMLQAAAQEQYHAYESWQEFPDDESVGAATVKSLPVISSSSKTPTELKPRLHRLACSTRWLPLKSLQTLPSAAPLLRLMPAPAHHLHTTCTPLSHPFHTACTSLPRHFHTTSISHPSPTTSESLLPYFHITSPALSPHSTDSNLTCTPFHPLTRSGR